MAYNKETKQILASTKKTLSPAQELFTNIYPNTWSGGLPTGWNVVLNSGSIEQSSDVHSGTYSAKITAAAMQPPPYVSQGVTGKTPDDILTASVWGKVESSDPPFDNFVWVLNSATLASTTHYWNGSVWAAMGTGGQLSPLEALGSNSTASYTQVTDSVTVPASGEVGVFVSILGPDAIGYVNELSLKTQPTLSTENFFDIVLKEAVGDMADGDTCLRIVDKNGVAIVYFDLNTKTWETP